MVAASRNVVLLGRYRLDGLIGQGGMGSVHRATDLRLEREVAVKVVSPQANTPETRSRFLREAQRTAQIRHPNVVEVFDVGETESGELFFVMELLRGEPLSTRLARETRFDTATFVTLAREICDGVGAAHAVGVIHRDIKPPNVMLVQHGNRHDLVKLLDFGISKAENASTQLTEAGMFLGTLEYIAPEQIMGTGPLDARADVYALGALFYRMLTGTALFANIPRTGLIHHHMEVMPDLPSARAPEANIPPSLEALVLRCLAKSPAKRPQTANDLRAALDEVVSELPPASLRLPKPRPAAPAPAPELDSATVVSRHQGVTTFDAPLPPAAFDLELAQGPRGGGTEIMARPVTPAAAPAPAPAQTCGTCGAIIAPTATTCVACGAFRARHGQALHAPTGELELVKVKRAPAPILDPGPPAWLVPLGLLPSWLAAVFALLCGAAAAGLWAFEVEAKVGYWALGVVFTLSVLGIFVRRRLEASQQ